LAPGIPEATGTIGPDLAGFASRAQIAATMDLNAENLTKWIQNPPAMKPGTAMPPLGLSEADVQTLVDWMLTLK
jgi:cytochrome c oxidase subunit 2